MDRSLGGKGQALKQTGRQKPRILSIIMTVQFILGGHPLNMTLAKRTFSLVALVALVLGCAVLMGPSWAGAAEPGAGKRQEWSAIEAEFSWESSVGVPLKDIINNAVHEGEAIHDVVAAAIKVGYDPSLVVYISLAEGYDAQAVLKAALRAGAILDASANPAAIAGVDKKSFSIEDILSAAIKFEVDPSLVVHTAIGEGYPAQTVVKVVLKAGVPLIVVVRAASDIGADRKSIYVGAAEAGVSPDAVERAMSIAKTPGASVFKPVSPTASTLPSAASAPAPAIFGRGGIILSQAPAWAAPTLRVGLLDINPFLMISETFGDNVTYTPADKKSDSITTVEPGVRLQLPFQTHIAGLEYYSVITRYGKYTEENINDHHVGGSVDFKAGDRLDLRLSDRFERGHDPRSSTPTGSNEVFHTNAATVSATYQFTGGFKAQLGYGKTAWRFITSHFRDREEDQLAGAIFYRVLPKTSLFVEYGHRKIAYSEETSDLDSMVGTAQAGLTWDLSARTKGTLKAGLAMKDFTSSAKTDGTVKVGSADVIHNFTSDTTLVLTAQRSLNEPDLPGSNYFTSTGGYLELTQRFLQKFAAVVRGAYVQDNNTARVDRTSLDGVGLKYRAKAWLEFAADYNRHIRSSNIPVNDYTEHSAVIMANFSL